MIYIFTHHPNIFKKENILYKIKKNILKDRGPSAVLESLTLGLNKAKIAYSLNSPLKKMETVHILSGVSALKWAIDLKRSGYIKELIAGPNLVVTPRDDNSILIDKNIDKILLPSEWTAKFYSSISPEISNKIFIWPAGVKCELTHKKKSESLKCLIYKKKY
ncbi:MAG: hypothetical protein NTV72_03505 [Candidatus Taylorbacteria bacterium]|nr:hypothetical protein [Candidatus Taylorbacteria bacterium]